MNESERSSISSRQGNRSRSSVSIYDLFILGLTIFSLIVTVGIVLGGATSDVNAVLWRVDLNICVIFFIDFLVRFFKAPRKGHYFFKRGGWLDLLGSVPAVPTRPWTVLLRLARLNRLVRIVRRLRGKDGKEVWQEAREKPASSALYSVILASIILITFSSLLILPMERTAADAEITTGADAFWWAFVTITTVGYGDFTPVTFPGRVVAMILMTFGIGIFAVLTSFVGAKFGLMGEVENEAKVGGASKEEEGEGVALLLKENAAIRAELSEIKLLLEQQGRIGDSK